MQDALVEYQSAMSEVGQGLSLAAETILQPASRMDLDDDGPVEGTPAYMVCVSMGQFGYRHMSSLSPEDAVHYLDLVRPQSHPYGRLIASHSPYSRDNFKLGC